MLPLFVFLLPSSTARATHHSPAHTLQHKVSVSCSTLLLFLPNLFFHATTHKCVRLIAQYITRLLSIVLKYKIKHLTI